MGGDPLSGPGALSRLTALRQHRGDGAGRRSPHKPLLVLLALGRLSATGSSRLAWSTVEEQLGRLLGEFGPPHQTQPAYPFTRLRRDGVWLLSREVPDDRKGPLAAAPIDGWFPEDIEQELRDHPETVLAVARILVEREFPLTLAPDVLTAVGLDPEAVLGFPGTGVGVAGGVGETGRRRDPDWRGRVVAAWDRACAFCGYDGAIAGAPVGIEAAHVRWFTFDGPDTLDNGLALCSLHHRLLDRGVLGLRDPQTIVVSESYSAASAAGRTVYALHGRRLRPRPGTDLPAPVHVDWHRSEVFKGRPLAA